MQDKAKKPSRGSLRGEPDRVDIDSRELGRWARERKLKRIIVFKINNDDLFSFVVVIFAHIASDVLM